MVHVQVLYWHMYITKYQWWDIPYKHTVSVITKITWIILSLYIYVNHIPDSKVQGAKMGPTWVLSAPDGPHVGPMNLAIRDIMCQQTSHCYAAVSPLTFKSYGNDNTHYMQNFISNIISFKASPFCALWHLIIPKHTYPCTYLELLIYILSLSMPSVPVVVKHIHNYDA